MAVPRGRMLARGHTSDVYEVGSDAVVKILRPGVPVEWAGIEARLTASVHDAGFPAPRVHDVGTFDGRGAIVFERIRGPSMWDCMRATPGRIGELTRLMARLQNEFHAADAPPQIPKLCTRVRPKIAAAARLTTAQRTHALWLLGRQDEEPSLCHGDLHPNNILLAKDGPVVIDWYDAVSGAGLADVVRTSLLVRPLRDHSDDLPHLAGATRDALTRVHSTYLRSIVPDPLEHASAMLEWERILAASRLAEGVTACESDLLALCELPPRSEDSLIERELRQLALSDAHSFTPNAPSCPSPR